MAAGDPYPRSPIRSPDKVRSLPVHPPTAVAAKATAQSGGSLPDDDEVYRLVTQALDDGYGGVILAGPPGTSKSYYADRIALRIADGDATRVRSTQFHPSYQYEDFIEGYVPSGGTFKPEPKHLLKLCEEAQKSKDAGEDKRYVLVIDELSRSDPARVFGEALTYVEATLRDKPFWIASGSEMRIPSNVVILATMNTFDRGVDDVDAAFDRRMAKIEMDPDPVIADQFMKAAGMEDELRARVLQFFRWIQRLPEKHAHLGHTFFMNLKSEDDLSRRWRYQLVHVFRKAYRLNDDGFRRVQDAWLRIFPVEEVAVDVEEPTNVVPLTPVQPAAATATGGSEVSEGATTTPEATTADPAS
jgi:5-methylcytosine-specific restriction enzyme B